MTDILVRGVPDDVVAAIDARASALGLSRSEYLRRRLGQELVRPETLAVSDLTAFADTFADLADPDVMGGAWS